MMLYVSKINAKHFDKKEAKEKVQHLASEHLDPSHLRLDCWQNITKTQNASKTSYTISEHC